MGALFWCGHPGGPGHMRRVGDGERGEQPTRGAHRPGYERRGAEAGGQRARVEVGRAGDAREGRQDGDGQQAAEPGHVVVTAEAMPECSPGAELIAVAVSGATVIASPSPKTTTAGST
jgi:hypothetical protein